MVQGRNTPNPCMCCNRIRVRRANNPWISGLQAEAFLLNFFDHGIAMSGAPGPRMPPESSHESPRHPHTRPGLPADGPARPEDDPDGISTRPLCCAVLRCIEQRCNGLIADQTKSNRTSPRTTPKHGGPPPGQPPPDNPPRFDHYNIIRLARNSLEWR